MNMHFPQEYVPSSHDILCGSGDLVRAHKGNHLFRLMLMKHFSLYERAATRQQKMGVTRLVFHKICLTGARFLRKDPIFQDRWYRATEKQGKDKISHCLRKMSREPRRHRVEAPWHNNTSNMFPPPPPAVLRSSDATSTMVSRALSHQSSPLEHRLSQPRNVAIQGIGRYVEESILKQQMCGHQRDHYEEVAWKDRPTTHFPTKEGIQSSACKKEGPLLDSPSVATNRWSTLGVAPPGIDWGFHEAQKGDSLLSPTLDENNVSAMQAMSASSQSAVQIWEELAATFASDTTSFTPTTIESQGVSL